MIFCIPSSFICAFWRLLYTLYAFGSASRCHFLIYFFLCVCLSKKKKKKDAAKVEESFLEKETFKALSDLNWDKAPRSDGFLMAF